MRKAVESALDLPQEGKSRIMYPVIGRVGTKLGTVADRSAADPRKTLVKIGSSGWIRTSNPPVNSVAQVGYLVGSSWV